MIPANHISFNDDGSEAWVVYATGYEADVCKLLDRPCDTCGGNWQDYMEPLDRDGSVVSPCPDCDGTGRHTFTIEVGGCICNGDSPADPACPGEQLPTPDAAPGLWAVKLKVAQ
jgi:hypothetical protein